MRNEAGRACIYDGEMPRKSAKSDGIRPEAPDWYLQEWMKTLRISQATLAKECDWTPSTMHGIFHGRTSYYRDIVNLIASKLHVEPFELLMHPDEAMRIRRFRQTALDIAAEERAEFKGKQPESQNRLKPAKFG